MRLLASCLLAVGLLLLLPVQGVAQDKPLKSLQTGNDVRGWDAVGRLDLGRRGFVPAR